MKVADSSIIPWSLACILRVMVLLESTVLRDHSNISEFYDPVLKQEFNIGSPAQSLPTVWWEGTSGGLVEPIWVTAERQGVISAIHMWPGSEAVIHGLQASHVDKFSHDEILSNKVDRIMTWLDLNDSERPAFIAAYVPNIDVCFIRMLLI